MTETVDLWFNPRCSKARATRALLEERGEATVQIRDYLQQPPSRAELENLLTKLGTDDPMTLVRTGEAAWSDLGLDANSAAPAILDAIVAHPTLLQRPIAVRGDRAVIGRPPEAVQSLFE